MPSSKNFRPWNLRLAAILAALSLPGCSTFAPPEIPPAPDPEPVTVTPSPEPVPAKPPRAEPVEVPPVQPALPPVAIVVTSTQPAYADVAEELVARLDQYTIYDLSDKSQPPVVVLRHINDSETRAVVAIGLRAAQSSVAMANSPVIFSQVFNHQDHDLVTASSRGVAALAPLSAQLAAWQELYPDVRRLGLIVGRGHDDQIAAAQVEAERRGIELRVRESGSDQETLYLFRRMVRDIDGFWLFPDNRILSPRVLQQMIADANRVQVPLSAPNESMLEMGASVSLATVAADIAETIVRLIRDIEAGRLASLPSISQLSEIRVTTREAPRVADR